MRRLFNLSALSAILVFVSCSGEVGEPAVVTDVPPSLQPDFSMVETIDLTAVQIDELRLETITAEPRDVDFDIVTQALAVAQPGNEATVSSPIDGRVVRIHRSLGENVRRGDPLISLQSLTYANMLGGYIQAKAELSYQEAQYNRALALNKQDITSISSLERSESELQRARAIYMASVANLKALGMTETEIQKLAEREDTDPVLSIYAPISGQIADIQIPVGAAIDANVPLLHMLDGKRVMVRCFVSPADQSYVKTGSSVRLLRGGTDTGIVGVVSDILPELDEDTRSIVALASVDTKDQWPRPGERFRVSISAKNLGVRRIAVPESAVMVDGQDDIAFVMTDDNTVAKKVIRIYRRDGGNVWIEEGIHEGDRVITNQLFTIKALFRVSQYSEE